MKTHTRRCANMARKILGEVGELRAHPQYGVINTITGQMISLAAFKSASGDDKGAMAIERKIRLALKKLNQGPALCDARHYFQLEGGQ